MHNEITLDQGTSLDNTNFIYNLIAKDVADDGQFANQTVHTRFPPEPNGYLHIGHCKALCIDFGMAERFNGLCNLRMDDTNPAKEDAEYVDAIKQDIHWLGFDWGDRFYYGSDYFDKDYEYAVELINKGLAYVCELTPEEFKANRGDTHTPATSPYRNRSIADNLSLFEKMKKGEIEEGKMTLRAKIDLTSGNFNMRDPVIYRIRFINHHRQGTKWCIFPMYDFAHPIQDALEGITHSLCSLEYEDHRPLYDWVVSNVSIPYHKPRQIEFARLNVDHTVMSKRKLRQLVEEHYVSGWDDPRMPTLCGLRRRGYTAASIRKFCDSIGVAKNSNIIEYSELERCLRDDLNVTAERTMAVIHPIKLTISNYPEGKSEIFEIEANPLDNNGATREISFSRNLWIEEDDFLKEPIPKYKRLFPGNEVRLKGAYLVTCTDFVEDENGNIVEVICEYDPDSKGGNPADGHKVKGATIHWIDSNNCVDAEVRIYENLFSDIQPDGVDKNFLDCLNPNSLNILTNCKVDRSMIDIAREFETSSNRTGVNAPTFQFMRLGFFCLDNKDCKSEHLVFNKSVSLKDGFKK